MIHSELPNEDGLKLWEEWSRRDNDTPTIGRTVTTPVLSVGKRVPWWWPGFGSLIRQADLVDPNKTRFQRDGLARWWKRSNRRRSSTRSTYQRGGGDRAGAGARGNHRKPGTAGSGQDSAGAEAGRHKEGAAAIDRMLDAHLTFERNKEFRPRDAISWMMLILITSPSILPKPWLLLVHADGSTGKSAMCQTLCKHRSGKTV